jgi:hypothetical protein
MTGLAQLHGRWLRAQVRIAKTKAGNKHASDADHKGAIARLSYLHGELEKLKPQKHKRAKKAKKKKK